MEFDKEREGETGSERHASIIFVPPGETDMIEQAGEANQGETVENTEGSDSGINVWARAQALYNRETIEEESAAAGSSEPEPLQFEESAKAASEGQQPEPTKKRSGNGATNKVIALILVLALSCGSGFLGGWLAGGGNGSGASDVNITSTGENLNVAEAIAIKVMPSVVGVSTKTETTVQGWFGQSQTAISEGVGTGIIVDESGYILTNSHVVSDGNASTILVDLYDGRKVEGSVLWNDTSIDLAIVKIEADDLTVAELGDSDEVNIGAYAAAIGNPMGLAFERSVTQGIISGLNRTITVSETANGSTTTMEGLLQTDASINSGNSGGPLINSAGQVIGINSAKAQSAEGLGFAIPINTAKPIINEIKEKGEFKKAYIGIGGVDLDTVIAT